MSSVQYCWTVAASASVEFRSDEQRAIAIKDIKQGAILLIEHCLAFNDVENSKVEEIDPRDRLVRVVETNQELFNSLHPRGADWSADVQSIGDNEAAIAKFKRNAVRFNFPKPTGERMR